MERTDLAPQSQHGGGMGQFSLVLQLEKKASYERHAGREVGGGQGLVALPDVGCAVLLRGGAPTAGRMGQVAFELSYVGGLLLKFQPVGDS